MDHGTGAMGPEALRDLLRAAAEAANRPVVERERGLVEVTVDANLLVKAVEFLDCPLAPEARAALQQATADAINEALRKAVAARAEAVMAVEKQLDWRELIRGSVGAARSTVSPSS